MTTILNIVYGVKKKPINWTFCKLSVFLLGRKGSYSTGPIRMRQSQSLPPLHLMRERSSLWKTMLERIQDDGQRMSRIVVMLTESASLFYRIWYCSFATWTAAVILQSQKSDMDTSFTCLPSKKLEDLVRGTWHQDPWVLVQVLRIMHCFI